MGGEAPAHKMTKYKYNPGDVVSNSGIVLLERIRPIHNGKGYWCKFLCPFCGKEFEADLYNIRRSYKSCGCYRDKYTYFQPATKYIGQRFGKLTVLEDDGTRVNPAGSRDKGSIKWKCLCDCGNITYVPSNHLTNGHTSSCGKCDYISNGEYKIQQFLLQNKIDFEQEKSFEDCRNPKTDCKLRFDFYLPNFNICVEYDGEQHFHLPKNRTSTLFTEEKIEEIQYRDSIKTQYCHQNNIRLIRIPYNQYNDIEQILIKELNL